MNFFRPFLIAGFLLLATSAFAQEEGYDPFAKGKDDTIVVATTTVNGMIMPWLPLNEIFLSGTRIFRTPEQQAQYIRLKRNVEKVLPYAVFARNRYTQLQQELAVTGDRKLQKKLVSACDKEIKDVFNKKIKDMTITQGEILIKLIDRETGNTSYEMVRQLKGGITAFGYQMIGKVFGHDLKQKYDAQEDQDIESIVLASEYYRNNTKYE